jgi:hypothetical protein
MTLPYSPISDLAKDVQPPDKGIVSRTVFSDDRFKPVRFGFAQGEELSEHTASMPAVLHFLRGEATVTLGDDRREAKPRLRGQEDSDPPLRTAGRLDDWHPGQVRDPTLGKRLRTFRWAALRSQQDLSVQTGISADKIRSFEYDEKRPTDEQLGRLPAVLGEELLSGLGSGRPG